MWMVSTRKEALKQAWLSGKIRSECGFAALRRTFPSCCWSNIYNNSQNAYSWSECENQTGEAMAKAEKSFGTLWKKQRFMGSLQISLRLRPKTHEGTDR